MNKASDVSDVKIRQETKNGKTSVYYDKRGKRYDNKLIGIAIVGGIVWAVLDAILKYKFGVSYGLGIEHLFGAL